jgi:transcription-repair coupling factor (superfamily II helicase)
LFGVPCPKETSEVQLSGLIPAALRDRGLARARDLARKGGADSDALDLTAPAALRPFVVAAVAAPADAGGAGRPVLAVTATSREADDLAEALGCLISPEAVAVFPSWETLPHERLSPRSDTVGRRLAVLRRLAHPGDDPVQVVVAPVRSVRSATTVTPRVEASVLVS